MDTRVIGKEKNLRQHLSEPYLADGRQDCGIRHHLQGKKKKATTQNQNKHGAAACQRVMFASVVLVAEERQGQGTVPLPVTVTGPRHRPGTNPNRHF